MFFAFPPASSPWRPDSFPEDTVRSCILWLPRGRHVVNQASHSTWNCFYSLVLFLSILHPCLLLLLRVYKARKRSDFEIPCLSGGVWLLLTTIRHYWLSAKWYVFWTSLTASHFSQAEKEMWIPENLPSQILIVSSVLLHIRAELGYRQVVLRREGLRWSIVRQTSIPCDNDNWWMLYRADTEDPLMMLLSSTLPSDLSLNTC